MYLSEPETLVNGGNQRRNKTLEMKMVCVLRDVSKWAQCTCNDGINLLVSQRATTGRDVDECGGWEVIRQKC